MKKITLPWPMAPILLPITEWLPLYNKELLFSDITAGFTVFVFLIPQGMAYALLAGMPPIYGLYSSIVPLYIYAVFGTSRQLSLGPMAITSLLLSVSVQGFGYEEQSDEYIKLTMNVSLIVGLLIFLLGLFRLGALANLISESVLVGFLTASAMVISLNQIKYLFGIHVPRFDYTYETIGYILTHLQETSASDCVLGLLSVALLYAIKVWRQKNKPNAERLKSKVFVAMNIFTKMSNFLLIMVWSMISYSLIQGGGTIAIVGTVPSGLKAPAFASIPFQEAISLLPACLAVAFVVFAGNWAVAKKYAAENNYRVDATQELIAEGLSVTVGVFFNCFAGSGGLARSAVNAESGAQTQLAGCIVATLILFSVQFLTKLFHYIPMCVLGAVIEVSVISMFDFEAMINAYKVHKKDCAVMVFTFLFTFFLGVSDGLFVGIFISIAMIIHGTAFPAMVHLGRLPLNEGGYYKDITRFQHAQQEPGVASRTACAAPLLESSTPARSSRYAR